VASSFKEEYLRHYIENGMAEGRRASLTFDPDYYWFIRPDVYEVWPDDYIMCARHYAGHGINAQIEAYDRDHPVVSDISVSDITASGYTVRCKVTDNWGISKVAFPTWTILNNQDDLADNFMNTQIGTVDGEFYTFRVNASNHNNEGGAYITHIYAIDNGGNRTQIILDTIEVKDPGPEKITLVSSPTYVIEDSLLKNVASNTTVDDLLVQFENLDLEVRDKNGAVLTGEAFVGTGSTINLYNGNTVVDSVTVMIMGDVDGNGIVNVTDYARIKSAFLGDVTFDWMDRAAADVDGSGVIDSTDYLRIKAHFLGMYNLYE
jgi:hypothetical protein